MMQFVPPGRSRGVRAANAVVARMAPAGPYPALTRSRAAAKISATEGSM
jgi:hypothetical protein